MQFHEDFTQPVCCSSLRKGKKGSGYVILQDKAPCKILDLTTCVTSKHGHSKTIITGRDIFTGKKVRDSFETHKKVLVPIVTQKEYYLCDIQKESVSSYQIECLDNETFDSYQIDLTWTDQTFLEEIKQLFQKQSDTHSVYLMVISTMNKDKIISYRTEVLA